MTTFYLKRKTFSFSHYFLSGYHILYKSTPLEIVSRFFFKNLFTFVDCERLAKVQWPSNKCSFGLKQLILISKGLCHGWDNSLTVSPAFDFQQTATRTQTSPTRQVHVNSTSGPRRIRPWRWTHSWLEKVPIKSRSHIHSICHAIYWN